MEKTELLNLLNVVHKAVLKSFIWTASKPQFKVQDDWQPPQLINGIIKDDCDGFVSYCYALLRRHGVSEELLFPVACETETKEWHVILCCSVDGTLICLDNRQRKLYTLKQLAMAGYDQFYRPQKNMPVSAPWEYMSV